MRCSFDSKEICTIENIYSNRLNHTNIQWTLGNINTFTSFNLTQSPQSGGNFIYVANHVDVSQAAFKTTTIINGHKKCLSFYYNMENHSNLEVFKVQLNGLRSKVFQNKDKKNGKLRVNLHKNKI